MKYKETRLGKCHPDFDAVPLKQMIEKNDAGTWGSDPIDAGNAVVRSTNFNDTGYLDLSNVALRLLDKETFEEKKILLNEILIERSGGSETQPVGRVSFITQEVADKEMAFANFIQRISAKEDVHPKFLFYCLYQMHSAGYTQIMQNQTNGLRNLEYRFFLNQILPKPKYKEQSLIAEILSSVDKSIITTKQTIQKLEKLKKSLMQNLLTGRVKSDGNKRNKREFYRDDKFGDIPYGWNVKKLKDVFEINEDTLTSKTDDEFSFNYISIESVETEQILFSLVEKLKFKNAPSRARRKLNKGDLLISTVRPNLKAFVRFNEEGNWICSTGFGVLRAKDKQDSDFYFYQILSFIGEKQFASFISGSNYPAISERDLKNIRVYEAPYEEQKLISEKLNLISSTIKSKGETIKRLECLKKSLLQNLLVGKVRVSMNEKILIQTE